mgnify:CR=1 FL=1
MNQWYLEFWRKNKKIIHTHILATVIIPPIEILLLTIYTKKLFKSLQENNFDLFVKLFIGFVIFLTVLQGLYAWKEYIDNQITPRVQTFIRHKCMYKYISQNRDTFKTMNVMNTISSLPRYFYQNYESMLKFWIPFVSTFFFYIIFLFWVDVKIGIVATIVFSTLLGTFYISYRKLSSYSNQVFQSQDELLHNYENILLNNETIQSYNKETEELENLAGYEKEFEKGRVKLIYYIDVVKFSFIIIMFIFLLSVFFYLYDKLKRNPDAFPTWKFITFITVLFFIVRYIITLMQQFRTIIQVGGMLYTSRNINVIDDDPSEPISFSSYDIEMKNISFSYPSNPTMYILENLNLKIPYKTDLCIKGKIGSGKSTIAKLLCKMYFSNEGQILIGGVDIKRISKKQHKQIIYMMNQNTLLFSGKTVFENICYESGSKAKKSILDAYELPSTFLEILDKKVIENGINISGGQKRLIYILRALLHRAPIVILDEPTDSLDKTSCEYMYKAIRQLQKSKTVICISHDSNMSSLFNTVYEMK